MSIHDKINSSIQRVKNQIETEEKDFASDISTGMGSVYSEGLGPKMKTTEYLKSAIGWVYGCVNVIADEIASIQLRVMKFDKNDVTEIDNHPALDLIYRSNNAMTRFDLIQLTLQYLELTGEAPWFILYGKNGKPEQIFLLRPDRLTVNPGKDGELIGGYKYKVYNENGVYEEIDLEPFQVVMLRYSDPHNPVRGKGPLQAAAKTYDIDNYAEKWNSQFFKNSASPSGAFETEKPLTPEKRKTLERKIRDKYSGVNNAHLPILLEGGMKFSKISLSQKDMDFIEQQRFSRDKILAIFRVPRTALGITDDVNRANAEATDYVFAKRTIKPKMMRLVEQLNEFLLPLFGEDTSKIYFDFDDPVPQNVEQNIAKASSGVTNGYMTINEAREIMGLDPIEDGDVLRDPASMGPIFSLGGSAMKGKNKKKVKTYFKHMNGVRSRKNSKKKTNEDYLQEVVRRTLEPIVYSLLRKKKGKAIRKSFLEKSPIFTGDHEKSREAKFAFQEKQLNIADDYESKFMTGLNSVFREQKEKAIAAIERGETSYKLPVDKQTEKYQEKMKPPFIQLMRKQADLAFQLVGVQKSFDTKAGGGFLGRLGDYFDHRIFTIAPQITKVTNEKLGNAFKEGTEKGESIPQLKTRVSDLFGDMEGYRAERIARTETIRASNFATEEAWKESGVVEAKEWLTTKDEATDDECMALDGKKIILGDKFFSKGDRFGGHTLDYEDIDNPPLHVNCRCTLIPVIESVSPDGWRPQMNIDQAEEWAANSKLKETFYHGTTQAAADSINQQGFRLSQQNISAQGIYLAGAKEDAGKYAAAASGGKGGAVIPVKINAQKVGIFDSDEDFINAIERKYGDITKEKASAFIQQFDAIILKQSSRYPNYVIIPNYRNVTTIRPKF